MAHWGSKAGTPRKLPAPCAQGAGTLPPSEPGHPADAEIRVVPSSASQEQPSSVKINPLSSSPVRGFPFFSVYQSAQRTGRQDPHPSGHTDRPPAQESPGAASHPRPRARRGWTGLRASQAPGVPNSANLKGPPETYVGAHIPRFSLHI